MKNIDERRTILKSLERDRPKGEKNLKKKKKNNTVIFGIHWNMLQLTHKYVKSCNFLNEKRCYVRLNICHQQDRHMYLPGIKGNLLIAERVCYPLHYHVQ